MRRVLCLLFTTNWNGLFRTSIFWKREKFDRLEEHKTTTSIFPISTWLKNLHDQATDGLMLSAVFRLSAISHPLKA